MEDACAAATLCALRIRMSIGSRLPQFPLKLCQLPAAHVSLLKSQGRQKKKKKSYIFSSQPRADQMLGPPREGQLMRTQGTSLHSASRPASMHQTMLRGSMSTPYAPLLSSAISTAE